MPTAAISQQNWVGGELSPKMGGRFDLPVYASGAEIMENFISQAAGPAQFRTGTTYVNNTRRNKIACLIPFQFSSSQSYLLEFTDSFIRFHRNNAVLITGNTTITGATAANPCVVTDVGHGYATGDEVIISGVKGMTQLNNRSFVITKLTADTYSLQDQFGTNINSTAFTAYASAGIAQKILEIASPYLEAELFQIKVSQNADTMYIVHSNHEPRKLVRSGATSWALSLFTRTADPFLSKKVITGISQANPAVVTSVAHGLATGTQVIIETVVGMTQVNGKNFLITSTGADTFSLQDLTGANIDSSAYTAWSAGGYASDKTLLPGAVAFFQGRIVYGYSDKYTQSIWGSRALNSSGDPQYDDMTTGANPADGFKFTLSPSTGRVDKIQSLVATTTFLGIATFEGMSKADGGTTGAAITPSNINVVPAVNQGVLQQITPIFVGINLMFIHRSGLIFYSLEFDIFFNAYNAINKNLTNDHITQTGIKQMVYQAGQPPIFWQVRNDGVLVGVTYLAKENINGAHRHIIGGTSVKVISAGNMPRDSAYDQLWVVGERVINGNTCRYVEYFNDDPIYPQLDDFYTADANATSDMNTWRRAMFEAQKQYIYVDASLTYDGSDLGFNASVSVTPGAVTGTGVAFTANGAIFTSDMVGREIWKAAVNGVGYGRAKITAFTSSTVVTCTILSDFDTVTIMAPGFWYLTTAAPSGLWHLEGQTVKIVTDGGEHSDKVVTNGTVALAYQASVVQIGLGYTGLLKSMNLEGGGQNGPSQTKPKSVDRLGLRFLNTLGARYGTSLYNMESVDFRDPNDYTGRPAPLFSGDKRLFVDDEVSLDEYVYIQQIKPMPCTVMCVVPFIDTDNE